MLLNSALTGALDRIAERAADVRRAYTPGAIPAHDDVASPAIVSDFTLDPLAVVAPDGTYFVTAAGGAQRTYTRDGAFAIRDGRLVAGNAAPVLGTGTAGGTLGELRIDPVDEALGRVRDVGIEPDGSFVYRRESVDPRTGSHELQRVVAGRIALARFPAGTRLLTGDGSDCSAPDGVAPQIGLPDGDRFAALAPMHRERSRVDVDESLIRLKDAYIAFDAMQAAEAAKGHLGKTAMDLLK